jgi:hypothetical protein
MYDEVKTKAKDIDARRDPALWEWFKQAFYLAKDNAVKKGEALKALLKLRMNKGDVEAYIKRFEALRESAERPKNSQTTLWMFQRGLGATHTREIQAGKVPRPMTLEEWYAMARNQWKGKEVNETINRAVPEDEVTLTRIDTVTESHHPDRRIEGSIARVTSIKDVSSAPNSVVVRTTKISSVEAARWRRALGIEKQRESDDVTRTDRISNEEAVRWQRGLGSAKKQQGPKINDVSTDVRKESQVRTKKGPRSAKTAVRTIGARMEILEAARWRRALGIKKRQDPNDMTHTNGTPDGKAAQWRKALRIAEKR